MTAKTAIQDNETIRLSRRSDNTYPRLKNPSHAKQVYPPLIHALLAKSGDKPSEFARLVQKQDSRNAMVMSLLDTQEEERKRISRELHDGLGQLLTHLKLQTQQCLSEVVASGKAELMGDALKTLEQLPSLVTDAIQEVRSVCRALRPAILDDLGVLAAISALCRKVMQSSGDLKIEWDIKISESDIPESTKSAIYRIVQEALTNCLKYAQADLVQVSLRKVENSLVLNIRDDGVGFDVKNMTGSGLGLISMQERALSQNGTFCVESAPLRGTDVQVTIPLNRQLVS
jgi:two-component system NarL family sensor kinase